LSESDTSPENKLQPETLAIHSRRVYERESNSILFPIHQTATYVHESVGVLKAGYGYSRGGNPTVNALEQAISALEGTEQALCFRSGMAAITTMCMGLLKAGDHVIMSEVIYGGTVRLFQQVLGNFGIAYSYVDTTDMDAVRAAIRPESKLMFVETPANPTMKLTDVAAMAEIAHANGMLLAVDNTFLTPLLQNVLNLGADLAMLSTTKYIDGHNATIGGSLASHDVVMMDRLRLVRKTIGTISSPMDAWLTLQGVKTLPTRLKMHVENAGIVAAWLEGNPRVVRVNYPGLKSFPQYELAQKQQKAAGGMLSFELDATTVQAIAFINALKLTTCAESLGSVESLITNPATASHCDLPKAERERLGISDGLIRLSVGLESPQDLIADFDRALTEVFQK
jgi:cystathionine gamma-lyase